METKAIYIYGIVPNFYGTTHFQSLDESSVYAITYKNISAIVSDRDSVRLDFLDRESLGYLLINHQETIEELMGKGFAMIIPMKLGTIVSSTNEVINILSKGYDLIIETLKKIEYLTEIDLAVTWTDFSDTVKEIAMLPEIGALRDAIQDTGEPATQADQVKIGMLIQSKLTEGNKQISLQIIEALSSCCVHVKIHDVMNDQMLANAAFLMNRNKREAFEAIINHLDTRFEGKLNFKLVGPLPCYSFFTIEVNHLNYNEILQAKMELGLREEISVPEIKKAYLNKAKQFHPDAQENPGTEANFDRINKAYQTLLEYFASAHEPARGDMVSLAAEKITENLIMVKIKE